MSGRASLSAAQARRVALSAQGFAHSRPKSRVDARHFRRAMRAIGVLQLDFVNVLMPAHFLMIWSRLGAYDRRQFERHLYDSGDYTEQWAHEASVVAVEDWPLLAQRREQFQLHKNNALQSYSKKSSYLRAVLQKVENDGAITAHDLPTVNSPKGKPGDWHRPIARSAVDHHFGRGALAVRTRLENFQRVYDLPKRLIAEPYLGQTTNERDAHRILVAKSAQSLGVATARDITDYYRMKLADVKPRIEELCEEGELIAVRVEGWNDPAFLSAQATIPRSVGGACLLSPFDPIVWYRPRVERLFGFEYRIEIYVPAAKRRWGYYVLPFRQGEALTARVDLKADRQAGLLRVQRAHLESGADGESTAMALANELKSLAKWQSLAEVKVEKRSAFEKALARRLRND